MTTNPQDLINFFTKVGQLKKIKRTGWVLRGVQDPESIADHSFRLALMAWIFGQGKKLDTPFSETAVAEADGSLVTLPRRLLSRPA